MLRHWQIARAVIESGSNRNSYDIALTSSSSQQGPRTGPPWQILERWILALESTPHDLDWVVGPELGSMWEMKGGDDAHIATGSDGLARAQRARLFCEAVYHVTCTFRQLVQKTRQLHDAIVPTFVDLRCTGARVPDTAFLPDNAMRSLGCKRRWRYL